MLTYSVGLTYFVDLGQAKYLYQRETVKFHAFFYAHKMLN